MSNYCPECGNAIPEWSHGICYTCVRIQKEYMRYGRRRPAARSRKNTTATVQRKKIRKRTRRSPAAVKPPAPPSPLLSPPQVEDLVSLRRGINRFLEAIYGDKRYLSDILREGDLEERQIDYLQQHCLSEFVLHVVAGWRQWLAQTIRGPQYRLLVSLYSLDGKSPLSLSDIGKEWDLPRSKCVGIWQEAIKEIRCAKNRPLESIALEIAQALLQRSL